MNDSHIKAPSGAETDSWVYTYTDECATPTQEGCACKLAAKDHTTKYHGSSASETLNNYYPEQNTLVVDRQVIEIETVGRTIYFKVKEEGETDQIMRLPLNLKQACVMLGMLAVAIGEVSPAKTSQEN